MKLAYAGLGTGILAAALWSFGFSAPPSAQQVKQTSHIRSHGEKLARSLRVGSELRARSASVAGTEKPPSERHDAEPQAFSSETEVRAIIEPLKQQMKPEELDEFVSIMQEKMADSSLSDERKAEAGLLLRVLTTKP